MKFFIQIKDAYDAEERKFIPNEQALNRIINEVQNNEDCVSAQYLDKAIYIDQLNKHKAYRPVVVVHNDFEYPLRFETWLKQNGFYFNIDETGLKGGS
jgi:hypothetical protein